MTVTKGKLVVAAVLAFLGLTLCAGYSLAAPNKILTIKGSCPDITSGQPFLITLVITNDNDAVNIAYDRVTIAYFGQDLTVKASVEGVIAPMTVKKGGGTTTQTVSFTVVTDAPTGTIIPLMVTLFKTRLSTDPDSFRGMVIVGAKVK